MADYVELDFGEFRDFFGRVKQAAGGEFKKELELLLEGTGVEFLRIVQDEIIRRQTTDTRQMLSSFSKGEKDNIWELDEGGLTLEVGSSLEYAMYADGGHWTVKDSSRGAFRLKTKDGDVLARFVPGYWSGDKFTYVPGSKEGMVLKQKWVEGSHFWDSAMRIFGKMFPNLLEAKIQDWIEKYFSEFL